MKHILGIYISGKLWRKIHLDDYPGFLKGEPITLGRRETCDIPIPQSIVSREHAHIVFDGKSVCIIDKDSLNGLEANGKRRKEIVLKNGTQVRIGSKVAEADSVVLMYVEAGENTVENEQKEEKPSKPVRKKQKAKRVNIRKNVTLSRMLAAMADWVVVMFMCMGFGGIIAVTMGIGGILKFLIAGGLSATVWLYYALSESGTNGTTFGKSLFGFKVVDKKGKQLSFKKAAVRTFAKIPSAFTLFLPVFGRGRCLHDIIAGTEVIRTDKKFDEDVKAE